MQKIMPCLWFDDRIEDAVNFYTSVFPNAKITEMSRYGDVGPMPKGKVLTAIFEIEGQRFMALNGGPQHKFSEAISFVVRCADQKEVDYYWSKLLEGGGREDQCAWLKERFGLSWQIVPDALYRYMSDKDTAKANRVMQAMLKMKKIIIADLDKAAAG